MFEKISRLPTSLKVVVWLNLFLAAYDLNNVVASQIVSTQPRAETGEVIAGLLSVGVSILIIAGILQRSRFIRILVLVVAWLGVVLFGVLFFSGIILIGLAALLNAIPLAIYGVTIWGLTTRRARRHFRV